MAFSPFQVPFIQVLETPPLTPPLGQKEKDNVNLQIIIC